MVPVPQTPGQALSLIEEEDRRIFAILDQADEVHAANQASQRARKAAAARERRALVKIARFVTTSSMYPTRFDREEPV